MTDFNYFIGIDPGANGGISGTDGKETRTARMPKDLSQLANFINWAKTNYNPVVFVEKLSIRKDDLAGGKVFRIQHMIENYANLKAVISLCGVAFAEVHPLTWQSRLKLRRTGEEKSERKRRYKDEAQDIFTSVKVTMANCDALLIMRFGQVVLQSAEKKDRKWISDNLIFNKDKRLL